MSYKSKLTAAIATLVSFVLLLAALLIWGGRRVDYHVEQSRIANAELETYLTLSADTFRLFKQLRRDVIDNIGEVDAELDGSQRNFALRLALLKRQIDEDQRLGARESRKEKDARQLKRLTVLTEEIQKALDDVIKARGMIASGDRRGGVLFLSRALEERVDKRVSRFLDEGIHFERLAANAAAEQVHTVVRQQTRAAIALAVLTTVLGVLLGLALLRRMSKPIALLTEGTNKFADGDLDYRLKLSGRDEFSQLAASFNGMAERMAIKREQIRKLTEGLEQKIAERTTDLQRANAELREKEDIRRQFFADVGHELRTPITVIRGEAEVALRAKSDIESIREKALTTIVEYTSHLTKLVSDIFLVARSEAGVLHMHGKTLDFDALVLKTAQDLAHIPAAAGQTLRTQIESKPIQMLGDKTRLVQLIAILVDNAARHAGPGAEVVIRLFEANNDIQLQVSDNGVGIAAADIPHVFDRYYSGNILGSGAGLGLPLARAIVKVHGGCITLASEPGKGTSLMITLPLSKSIRFTAEEVNA